MMSLTIADILFEHVHYDPRGDVLYLSVEGYAGPPADALPTDEGHNVEFDETGRPIGMTLTNVRWYLQRDGGLTITLPVGLLTDAQLAALGDHVSSVTAAELAPALRAAA